jgi:putative LysE/RhtB family amino acid efflux pump
VDSAVIGFGLGFFVAMQLGPMSLLLIRATLGGGWRIGVAVGAGIATVDGLYAAAGSAGLAPALQIQPVRLALGLAGAALLVWLGLRTVHDALRVRAGGEAQLEVLTSRRAFVTSAAGTASNPLTVASWAAVFAVASTAGAARSSSGAILLVFGVTLGSLTWGGVLSSLVAVSRRALSRRWLGLIDLLAGAAMVAFGGLLASSTIRDS